AGEADCEHQELARVREVRSTKGRAIGLEIGELSDPCDRVRNRPEGFLRVRWRLRRRRRSYSASRRIQESSSVQRRGIDSHGLGAQDNIHRMIDITRDACLRGEVVCPADWNDTERRVESAEAAPDYARGAVGGNCDHSVRT